MTDRVISLAALTVLGLTPPEMVETAAHCGYSHVGLRPIAATPDEPFFPLVDDPAMRRETLARLSDLGIGVLDIEILRLRPETVIAEFEPFFEFGAACDARFALIAGNDPDPVRLADNFATLCDLASPFGISPHLEFMPWTDVPNVASALAVVERAGRPNGGALVDAFHLNRSGGKVGDIPAHDPRFGYIQFCDIAGPVPTDMQVILQEARGGRLFPGEGDCPLVALLQRLPADIPISIEAPVVRADLTADARAQLAIDATRRILAQLEAQA